MIASIGQNHISMDGEIFSEGKGKLSVWNQEIKTSMLALHRKETNNFSSLGGRFIQIGSLGFLEFF